MGAYHEIHMLKNAPSDPLTPNNDVLSLTVNVDDAGERRVIENLTVHLQLYVFLQSSPQLQTSMPPPPTIQIRVELYKYYVQLS